jgi:hypothetical protein
VATVSIRVNVVIYLPLAVHDAHIADEDTPSIVATPSVLSDDSKPDSDPLMAALLSGVSHGTRERDPSLSESPCWSRNVLILAASLRGAGLRWVGGV